MHDVVIIGAGPAGATAAAILAREEIDTLLVDRDNLPRRPAETLWLSARAAPLLKDIGLDARQACGRPFAAATLFSPDLEKTAQPKFEELPGYLVDRDVFENALREAATTAGATLRTPWPVKGLSLDEHHVTLQGKQGPSIEGRMLLMAGGFSNPLIERVAKSHHLPPPQQWTIRVASPLTARCKLENPISVVLGLDRQGTFGVIIATDDQLAINVCGRGDHDEARGMLFQLCRGLADRQLVPVDLSAAAAKADPFANPAGMALEMDSHVSKHALVIGDAGGFVSAASQEGVYPAMWSAQIAAGVVKRSLGSMHSQDVLMEFDHEWRVAMADYLRAPNTDIQFLLPLIFSNQPMADRLGAAFFLGQSL